MLNASFLYLKNQLVTFFLLVFVHQKGATCAKSVNKSNKKALSFERAITNHVSKGLHHPHTSLSTFMRLKNPQLVTARACREDHAF